MKWPFSYSVTGNEGLFVFSQSKRGGRDYVTCPPLLDVQ